mmetsp:Transcript_44422/g.86995  ORF Transcript_44422/g.86995 Transcript_44422/m.86995 type:complete len:255 (-) Transcript_44422:310-1074(-)
MISWRGWVWSISGYRILWSHCNCTVLASFARATKPGNSLRGVGSTPTSMKSPKDICVMLFLRPGLLPIRFQSLSSWPIALRDPSMGAPSFSPSPCFCIVEFSSSSSSYSSSSESSKSRSSGMLRPPLVFLASHLHLGLWWTKKACFGWFWPSFWYRRQPPRMMLFRANSGRWSSQNALGHISHLNKLPPTAAAPFPHLSHRCWGQMKCFFVSISSKFARHESWSSLVWQYEAGHASQHSRLPPSQQPKHISWCS